MGAVEGWVRQLAAVVLLAGVTETLLPSGTLRGYARALLSLLVLLVVLRPVMALAHERVSLELPGLTAPASGTAAAPAEAGGAQAAAAAAYEQLLAQGVRSLAAGVAGVLSVQVRLTFASSASAEMPEVTSAFVAVTPTAEGAADPTLAGRVRQTVAAALSLPLGRVEVTS